MEANFGAIVTVGTLDELLVKDGDVGVNLVVSAVQPAANTNTATITFNARFIVSSGGRSAQAQR
jgi:hypothetical protein